MGGSRRSEVTYVVHRQPFPLDRITVHEDGDTTLTSQRVSFTLLQVSRFRQVVNMVTLQTQSEAAKVSSLSALKTVLKSRKLPIGSYSYNVTCSCDVVFEFVMKLCLTIQVI